VGELLALVGFSVVSSVTPGPNNVLLWASGTTFGFRRTLRHVVGTALGIGSMALAVAAGLGTVVTALPAVAVVMKIAGSGYLLVLAVRIARSGSIASAEIARPLGIGSAAAFQLVNPKAWVFALGAVTTFRPVGLPVALGSLLVAATMTVVVIPTASLWAAGGGLLGRLLDDPRSRRVVSLVLAAVVVATVAAVWS